MRLHNPPAHLIFLLNAGKQFTSMFHKLVAEARKTSAIQNRGRFGGNGIAQPDRILVTRNFNCKNVCKMSVGILGNIRKSSLANPRRRCSVTTSSLPGIISGSNTIPSRPSAVRFACFSLTVCRNSLSMISPDTAAEERFGTVAYDIASCGGFSENCVGSSRAISSCERAEASSKHCIASAMRVKSPSCACPSSNEASVISLEI